MQASRRNALSQIPTIFFPQTPDNYSIRYTGCVILIDMEKHMTHSDTSHTSPVPFTGHRTGQHRTPKVTPFVWDRDYNNNEQVRPYYPAYLARRNELTAAGKYPYNDSFKGYIPGIEGEREDTAIYMLQTMHSLDEMREQLAEFEAAGGIVPVLGEGEVKRGDVAVFGWYSGGTGFQIRRGVRLINRGGRRGLAYIPKSKRTPYMLESQTNIRFIEGGQK